MLTTLGIIIFFLLFGIPILILCFRLFLITNKKLWLKTSGDVLSYKIIEKVYPSKFKTLQDDVHFKYLRIKYKYAVNNKTYISTRTSLDFVDIPLDGDFDAVLKSLYHNEVEVYYVRHLPSVSVLLVSIQKGKDHIVLLIVLIFVMISSVLFIYLT